jgi:hypothetical protein
MPTTIVWWRRTGLGSILDLWTASHRISCSWTEKYTQLRA